MKFPIEWHEKCLKNKEDYVNRLRELVHREILDYVSARRRLNFYRRQVEEAKRQGKEGFDSERFLQKEKRLFSL